MAVWASGESEPRDIAPPTKCFMMDSTDSTSSTGMAVVGLKRKSPRSVQLRFVWSSISSV